MKDRLNEHQYLPAYPISLTPNHHTNKTYMSQNGHKYESRQMDNETYNKPHQIPLKQVLSLCPEHMHTFES